MHLFLETPHRCGKNIHCTAVKLNFEVYASLLVNEGNDEGAPPKNPVEEGSPVPAAFEVPARLVSGIHL